MALRLAIEQSEREAKEAAAEAARVAKLKQQQDKAVRWMKGLVVLSSSSSDSDGSSTSSDGSSTSSDDQDPPPAADAYSYAGDRKGKDPTRKCSNRTYATPAPTSVCGDTCCVQSTSTTLPAVRKSSSNSISSRRYIKIRAGAAPGKPTLAFSSSSFTQTAEDPCRLKPRLSLSVVGAPPCFMMGSSSSWSVPPASGECSLQNVERYEITKALMECKMAERSSVSQHLVKLVRYMWRLEALGSPIPPWLCTDLILLSLPPSFNGFIMNYMMCEMDKSVNELLVMLKNAEFWMQKGTNHLTKKTTNFKKKGKVKNGKGVIKTDTKRKPKRGATKETQCFFCKDKGHWKRNCKKFLAEKKKSGKSSTRTSEDTGTGKE
ncbi:uncharacterized protein [Triticum aestivum]|uniref:uncharacterized protein n=1 Tax=Triticum aestivum TaxID=4565 RepID=UPI001D01D200|nr:uncharacterized protein LOC123157714 [Triticum aestivum]